MNSILRPNYIILILLLVVGSGLVHSLLKATTDFPASANTEARPAPERTMTSDTLVSTEKLLPPLSEMTETVQRPLFYPHRRPFPPRAVEADNQNEARPQPPPDIKILGVATTHDKKIVLIHVISTGKILHLSIGDFVLSWKVVEISKDRVVITLNDRMKNIQYEKGRLQPIE